MTDKKRSPEDVDLLMNRILDNATQKLFESFDMLHERNIHDDEVILSLRRLGWKDLAEGYLEWSGALDPERDANETLGGAVPDPVPAASYDALSEALNRNALNAYLRSDEIKTFGARENTLQMLRQRIPKGTKVAYWPDGDYRSAVWTEAITSCEVFVAAGTPVVSLESGRQAVPLSYLQVIA